METPINLPTTSLETLSVPELIERYHYIFNSDAKLTAEYDKLKEDNEILKTNISVEYDKGLNHGLQLSSERDQEIITKLKEDNALLIEALDIYIKNEQFTGLSYKEGDLDKINKAKELLNSIQK